MFHCTRTVFLIFLLAGYASAMIIAREQTNRDSEPVELDGQQYHLELLSEAMQGARSSTYDILEGFLLDNGSRAPAILKVISYKGSDSKANIKKEIKYLTKVQLHLFTKFDNVAFYTVVLNVRKTEPPLKPYHEWYLEDSNRNLEDDLETLETNIMKKLMMYTGPTWKLIYEDIDFLNIYVDETLQTVMPIDWGPAIGKLWGVKEVTKPGDIEKYQAFLLETIPLMISCNHLMDVLGISGDELWPWDYERRICTQ